MHVFSLDKPKAFHELCPAFSGFEAYLVVELVSFNLTCCRYEVWFIYVYIAVFGECT